MFARDRIFGFSENFEFLLTEMKSRTVDSDDIIGPGVASWIVWEVFIVIGHVRRG